MADTYLGKFYEFVHPGVFDHIKEECDALNGSLHVRNMELGAVYFTSGLLYEFIYFPCLIVMLKPRFIKVACYKILFAMGVTDMFSLLLNAIFAGYFLMVGGSVCTHPLMNLYGGHTAFALWCSYCAFGIILGLNRCVDFLVPQLADKIFHHEKIFIWISIPIIYMFYVLIHENAPVFHPILAGYFFDINPMKAVTTNILHAVNNLGVTAIVFVLNIIMLLAMSSLMKKTSLGITKSQKVIMIQCLGICIVMMVASAIYVFMQFCKFPMIFTVISTMLWQFSNGGPGMFYLIVNRTMREEVIDMFACVVKKTVVEESSAGGGIPIFSTHSLPQKRLPPVNKNAVYQSNAF